MKRNDNYNLLGEKLYKIKHVYCYGENKEDFYNYFFSNNIKCSQYNTLEEVIRNLNITNNQVLLFSPGSISHDQFKNFEDRGNEFNKLIHKKYNF